MILKLISGACIIVCGTLLGAKFAERKKLRKNFYNDILIFCNNLLNEVSFSYKTIDNYIKTIPSYIKVLLKIDETDYLKGNKIYFDNKNFSAEECSEVTEFFNQLGCYSDQGMDNFIKFYIQKFNRKYSECENIYKRTFSFYIKMGALSGTLIFILMI